MNEHSDEYFMAWALQCARKAYAAGEVPVGAVVVAEGKVIGEGWNGCIAGHDPTAHAEIRALRDAGLALRNYRLPATTLYVTIEPCTMCLGAIVHARVGRVVFGAQEPKAGVLHSHPLWVSSAMFNHSFTWQGGILEQECSALIQDFFRRRRAQKKTEKLSLAESDVHGQKNSGP